MTVIAVTGHRKLSAGTAGLVARRLQELLDAEQRPLVGVSCLAEGADQIFADAMIWAGGELQVVLPAEDYRQSLPPAARECYDTLLGKASLVHPLPFRTAGEAAYQAAAEELLARADELIAVWDGGPSRGPGGTAEVVEAARRRGMRVRVIWPPGAAREEPAER
ncbi:hypothetical protein [Nonomuraea sp. NPDC050310]|uniref:hypothetical protein n=1 Tax=unclassified Nonomuraea TaxID=2593643 RepID=UPI0033DC9D72